MVRNSRCSMLFWSRRLSRDNHILSYLEDTMRNSTLRYCPHTTNNCATLDSRFVVSPLERHPIGFYIVLSTYDRAIGTQQAIHHHRNANYNVICSIR